MKPLSLDPSAPSRLRVRRMEAADLPEVVRLERASFADPWSEASFHHEITDPEPGAYPRVVEVEGSVAGYLIGWFVLDEAHLANLAVAPELRGQRIGALLVEDFLREGIARGCTLSLLEVRVSNVAAIRLYERFGFRGISVRKNYYAALREDALVMMRPLGRQMEETDGVPL